MKHNFSLENIDWEVWVASNFNRMYHVSSYGRVKIFCKDLKRSKTYPRIGKPYKNKFGYYWHGLIDENKIKKTWFVHRLVATHFIPNPENKPQVNHRNGNKLDNIVENLEWVTALENTTHSNETGLVNIKGERNCSSKLTERDVLEIFKSKEPSTKICHQYGVKSSVIRTIRNGRGWNHVTGLPKKRNHNQLYSNK
jgi:hypothetical protein